MRGEHDSGATCLGHGACQRSASGCLCLLARGGDRLSGEHDAAGSAEHLDQIGVGRESSGCGAISGHSVAERGVGGTSAVRSAAAAASACDRCEGCVAGMPVIAFIVQLLRFVRGCIVMTTSPSTIARCGYCRAYDLN